MCYACGLRTNNAELCTKARKPVESKPVRSRNIMKTEDKKDLSQFLQTPETPPKYKICVLCLEEVERKTYDQHMRKHRYGIIEVTPMK